MTIVDRRALYQGHLRVQQVTVRDEAGQERKLEVVERRDAVAALVLDPGRQRYLLVEQWRAGAEAPLLELPAGLIDEGEDPATALRRELEEELGGRVGELTAIATFYTTPGFCTEQIHLFYAELTERTGAGGGKAEEGEQLEVRELTWDELAARPLRDAKTLVAVEWARSRREAGAGQ